MVVSLCNPARDWWFRGTKEIMKLDHPERLGIVVTEEKVEGATIRRYVVTFAQALKISDEAEADGKMDSVEKAEERLYRAMAKAMLLRAQGAGMEALPGIVLADISEEQWHTIVHGRTRDHVG